jgi:hypothetical protein
MVFGMSSSAMPLALSWILKMARDTIPRLFTSPYVALNLLAHVSGHIMSH